MKSRTLKFASGLWLVVLILVSAIHVQAQCADYRQYKSPTLKQQAFRDGSGRLLLISDDDAGIPTIVGLWRVVFTAKGNTNGFPDGAFDRGFQQWHSDHTELLNSSRPPVTGSFCTGTWKRTGPFSYVLNHFGISWDGEGHFVGLANIRENVTLSRDGKSYTGTFTIDQYDPNNANPFHIQGEIVGQRVDVNTTVQDLIM
jgi:hypothetical protein